MKAKFTWDSNNFYLDGKVVPLISGEFHYFRVPKDAWRERLILLRDSGANCVATYIPWIVHEPDEGRILFDDVPERCLTEFLTLCNELELMVMVRPGPYSYSELCNDGLPFWLGEKYPETRAHGAMGECSRDEFDASYMHPVFLEKAREYIREVNRIVKPHLATNGGCVVMTQIDNEIGGKDIWRSFIDCNKEGMGIGTEDGRYVRFLEGKYGSVEAMNLRYGTEFASFLEVDPYVNTPKTNTVGGKRFAYDYRNFYKETLDAYVRLLAKWNEEDGIDVDYCTNAGSPGFIPILRDTVVQNKDHHFFLGVDVYYALSPAAGISMTPEKTVKYAMALDMLHELGMPQTILEMQSGSASCYPPILPENLYGFYMTNVALGMKGSNYYVFTGGPNFENTGNNTEIYDYHAPVSATGEVRPIYYAQKERNLYSQNNGWLLSAERRCDVQLGFCWETVQDNISSSWDRYSEGGISTKTYTESLLLTLGLSGRLFRCKEIGGVLDVNVPLIAVTDERMPKAKQEALVDFVKRGGKLILAPTVPTYDEDLVPCTVLADFLGVCGVERIGGSKPLVLCNGEKIYEAKNKFHFSGFCGESLCATLDGKSVIEHKAIGKGEIILMGVEYGYSQFCQMDMLEYCLARLGGERIVTMDSKNLIVTLFEDDGHSLCFLINNLAGAVETDVSVRTKMGVCDLGRITVPPMTVLPVDLTVL